MRLKKIQDIQFVASYVAKRLYKFKKLLLKTVLPTKKKVSEGASRAILESSPSSGWNKDRRRMADTKLLFSSVSFVRHSRACNSSVFLAPGACVRTFLEVEEGEHVFRPCQESWRRILVIGAEIWWVNIFSRLTDADYILKIDCWCAGFARNASSFGNAYTRWRRRRARTATRNFLRREKTSPLQKTSKTSQIPSCVSHFLT